jgi:peptide/nickel transport system substrate-binding protein
LKTRGRLVAVVIALLAVLLSVGIPSLAGKENTLTVAIRNWDYDTLDPHISAFTQSMWMVNCFTDTLVRIGPDGKFSAGLASSWESRDGAKVWVFHLRQGVTFHDGTPWNGQALVDNFERVRAPETKSLRYVDKLKGLVEMKIVDPMTVELIFDSPKPGFLLALSEPICGFLSPTAFKNPANVKSSAKLKGTGPYILAEEIYQQKVTFVKNSNYNWGPEFAAHKGPANIDNIVWRFIPEDETRLAALQTEEVDLIDEVAPAEIAHVRADPKFNILFYYKPGIAQVYHLNATLPPTNDLAVRRAIQYAIDQKTIAETIFMGSRPPAYGLFMPPSPYYNKDIENMYTYDPEKAIQILEEAGWVDPTGTGTGTRQKDGKLLIIDFVTYPGFVAEAPAEMAQAMLHKVGIQMNITVLTGGAMMEQCGMKDSTWNSCLCGDSAIDSAMEAYYFCYSESIGMYNFAHYTTPELDNLINTALQTTDEAVKDHALKEIQRIWMEQALCKPIVCSTNVWGANARVQGVSFLLDGTPTFYDAKF